ncbi:MAG: hypothetical protein M1820_002165 [Bogoriella megaspora]|nr:MAG: hypothetical protein M1820_002165 [Bogoriella megaspora]
MTSTSAADNPPPFSTSSTSVNPAPPSAPPPPSTSTSTAPPTAPASASSAAVPPKTTRAPSFPPSNAPRVWLLTSGASPIAVALSRLLLAHGDYVLAGVAPGELSSVGPGGRGKAGAGGGGGGNNGNGGGGGRNGVRSGGGRQGQGWGRKGSRGGGDEAGVDGTATAGLLGSEIEGELYRFMQEVGRKEEWRGRWRVAGLDVRNMGQCQAAVAEAVEVFGRIDILLCCTSEAVIGAVEELSQNIRTQGLIRDQFETNFFGPVNIVKAILPTFRARKQGHVLLLTAITGHIGTPGLAMYCASQWAVEGYCDSLAYEVAPFNVKVTIVQPTMEVPILTSPLTAAPPHASYTPDVNPAPLARNILSSLLDKLEGTPEPTTGDQLWSPEMKTLRAPLTQQMLQGLVAETVHALAAIGGHDNPPARHIVGFEGVAAVKEKLKTVSEELEDFVEVSSAVDIDMDKDRGTASVGSGGRERST